MIYSIFDSFLFRIVYICSYFSLFGVSCWGHFIFNYKLCLYLYSYCSLYFLLMNTSLKEHDPSVRFKAAAKPIAKPVASAFRKAFAKPSAMPQTPVTMNVNVIVTRAFRGTSLECAYPSRDVQCGVRERNVIIRNAMGLQIILLLMETFKKTKKSTNIFRDSLYT